MVEQLLIGQLLTIADCTEVFHLNTGHLLDDLISLSLKLDHRWRVCGNGVGGPDLRMDDAVKPPPKLNDCTQASQTVLAIA